MPILSRASHHFELPTNGYSRFADIQRIAGALNRATYFLKEAITASLYPESSWMVIRKEHRKGIASFGITSFLKHSFLEILSSQNFLLVKKRPFDPKIRTNGEDWPMFGYSMIGHRRLDNIEYCIRSALSSGVEGDFVECGVWRGGASIYARSVLNLLGAQDRTVWLADSFEGFPVQKQEDKLDPAASRGFPNDCTAG